MPDYHAWTHRPKSQGGTDPLDLGCVQWAYADVPGSTNVLNNTITDLTFVNYAISDNADAFVINTATKPFSLQRAGFYMFWVDAEWSGSGYADVRNVRMTESDAGQWINNDSTFQPRNSSSDPHMAGQTFTWGPLMGNFDVAHDSDVGIAVRQSSGSTQTLNGCKFTVVFLCAASFDDYDADFFTNRVFQF